MAAIRGSARLAEPGGLALRGGKYGAFVACSNYPDCKYTQKFGQGGADAVASDGPVDLGEGVTLRSGRFGAYVQQGEEKDAKRASIPKDVGTDGLTLEMAQKLLSLPRVIGPHPETGTADQRIDRALRALPRPRRQICPAQFDRRGVRDGHERGGGQACRSGGGKGQRGGREPLAVLGVHPESAKELKVMEGRYGPYVTDGTTHATLPKSADPKAVTLDEAIALIDAKAAKGPSKKGGRKPAAKKKAPAKKKAKA